MGLQQKGGIHVLMQGLHRTDAFVMMQTVQKA